MCKALAAAALVLAASGCRAQPIDQLALLTARDLGLTELERGELPEAEQHFKTVASLAPRDPLGYINLGLTYVRGARYQEAESALLRARRLDPANPDIGLILAKLYALTGRPAEARTTLERLPRDARVLYALAELDAGNPDRLREVLAAAPANLAVRLQLADAFARRGEADSAARALEEARRLRPEPPKEAARDFAAALEQLRAGNTAAARAPLDRFLHIMETTAPYQASLAAVRWTEGPLVGRPVLTFTPQSVITLRGVIPVHGMPEVRFTDVTAEAGLSDRAIAATALALGDYDGEGEDNLLVSQGVTRLYNMHRGYVTERPRTELPAVAVNATFADYDNDGWLDLFVIGGDSRAYLLRNKDGRAFDDVSAASGVVDAGGARKALFFDFDHDGDLDLLLAGGPAIRLYRNNLDGTFTDVAGAAGLTGAADARDAAFGDFDGDGRLDLVVISADGGDALFQNTGFRGFRDATAASGLTSRASGALAVGDYDNDGALDILVAGAGGASGGETALWHNEGTGTFTADRRSARVFAQLRVSGGMAAHFVDYDNDGWLDLFVAGRGGGRLLHNAGSGRFEDRTMLLPASARAGSGVNAIAVADADGDGDQDLLVADSGGVHLLRNDGGNAHLSMQVQLTALRTGSGKNNTFGVGARLEVRAGDLYQTRVVTDRVTPFGLGPHLKADVVRVQWTNGVPQTVYFPGTDADVLELEQLKGSCAFLYTWDGTRFRFITDVMWRSALGMPLGIMGEGAGREGAAYAPAGASQEYLRIPGDALQPRDGRYVLQFTEELWETAYLDEIRLLAVDHPDSVDAFVDERFVPPGPVSLRLFQATRRHPPLAAVDERGRDVLAALRERDDVYVSDFTPLQYQGLVEPHALILDLGEDAGRAGSLLFLRGWIYPTDASINVALSQQTRVKIQLPSLEVRDARGRWTTAIPSIGFPSGKDKTIVIDLAGKFPTTDHHVRIRTNMQIYWGQAFVARDAPASPVRITPVTSVSADLHLRGFSRMYRRGGRNGPHWFAYDDVSKDSPWRPITGAFTRYGDVLPLLRTPDDMYVIMAPGDEATVEFAAGSVDSLPLGWTRTFLLYSDGWIKDADLNTAFGNSVGPLPFHGITAYPYAPQDSYPGDAPRRRYLREYNSRVIERR